MRCATTVRNRPEINFFLRSAPLLPCSLSFFRSLFHTTSQKIDKSSLSPACFSYVSIHTTPIVNHYCTFFAFMIFYTSLFLIIFFFVNIRRAVSLPSAYCLTIYPSRSLFSLRTHPFHSAIFTFVSRFLLSPLAPLSLSCRVYK